MSFGTKLQDARTNKHLTQEQLAGLLGVTRQSVSRWESDVVYPDLAKIVRLSELLGVSTDYLLKNEEFVSENKKPSKFLTDLVGKKVTLGFYDTDEPLVFPERNESMTVLAVDSSYMKVSVHNAKKNTDREIDLPLSEISSVCIEV
ncbi:MAG: helix-turn-helix domain-containing protein [Clostridia bacterium]|nr:helix-turn-helix domain-containing protein [Clostridia bacterium]